MAKPLIIPPWATDANHPAGANTWNGQPNKEEPSSTLRARGWNPNEKPPAEVMNAWQNDVGSWIAWLNGEVFGNLTAQTVVVAAGLTVGGATTLGPLAAGATTITGTLTVSGEIYSPFPHTCAIPAMVGKAYDAPSGPGLGNPGVVYDFVSNRWIVQNPAVRAGRVLFPITNLVDGDKITHIGMLVNKASSGATTMRLELSKFTLAAGESVIAAHPGNSANAPGPSQMTYTLPAPIPVEQYATYFLSAYLTGTFVVGDEWLAAYFSKIHTA